MRPALCGATGGGGMRRLAGWRLLVAAAARHALVIVALVACPVHCVGGGLLASRPPAVYTPCTNAWVV